MNGRWEPSKKNEQTGGQRKKDGEIRKDEETKGREKNETNTSCSLKKARPFGIRRDNFFPRWNFIHTRDYEGVGLNIY